eukprot:1162080-Pelagomonas_calceolata.AAC.15
MGGRFCGGLRYTQGHSTQCTAHPGPCEKSALRVTEPSGSQYTVHSAQYTKDWVTVTSGVHSGLQINTQVTLRDHGAFGL